MPFDAFISYSSQDKITADAACAALEAANIRCWIAPRDINPGRDYGASIIDAIEGAKAFVLILSTSANASPQIKREVERAVSKGLPIIPVRIEDVVPNRTLEISSALHIGSTPFRPRGNVTLPSSSSRCVRYWTPRNPGQRKIPRPPFFLILRRRSKSAGAGA